MPDPKEQTSDPKDDTKTPDMTDIEPGSDADETPIAEPGHTPPDPNKPG